MRRPIVRGHNSFFWNGSSRGGPHLRPRPHHTERRLLGQLAYCVRLHGQFSVLICYYAHFYFSFTTLQFDVGLTCTFCSVSHLLCYWLFHGEGSQWECEPTTVRHSRANMVLESISCGTPHICVVRSSPRCALETTCFAKMVVAPLESFEKQKFLFHERRHLV